MGGRTHGAIFLLGAGLVGHGAAGAALATSGADPDIIVVTAPTPLSDGGARQTATAADIAASHALGLTDYLNRTLGSVFVNDVQNNPLQPGRTMLFSQRTRVSAAARRYHGTLGQCRPDGDGEGAMIAAMLGLLLAAAPPTTADPADFDPATGYRIAHYRAVVPIPPAGVPRIAIDDVVALARGRRALLIDVTPAEGGIADAVTGRWRLAEPHRTIPGAHWFPEAGRGRPTDAVDDWLNDGVRHFARRRPGGPIVVFCLADCWMSWNAALRLHRAGFGDVRWFAEGIDGWREAGLALAEARPRRFRPGGR